MTCGTVSFTKINQEDDLAINGSKVIVTGAAGFIGSHLADSLLKKNCSVIGIDCLTSYYSPEIKLRNISSFEKNPNFRFVNENLEEMDYKSYLDSVDYVFHLAGQPGVRLSWGKEFADYVNHNIHATQKLLEAIKGSSIKKLVYASSSSIYGNSQQETLTETDVPKPFSPYGVTKLAGEHLVVSYSQNFQVPTASLRFFTVFGPRQRPDMAFQRIAESIIGNKAFPMYGDGSQIRDFTFVSDIVDGCISAAEKGISGDVYNLGGSNLSSMREVLDFMNQISDGKLKVDYLAAQKGDVFKTSANIKKAQAVLGYNPLVRLHDGLTEQFNYVKSMLK